MKWLFITLGLIGAGTVAYFWYDKKSALVSQVNVKAGIPEVNVSLSETKFTIPLTIINPSEGEETINSFTANVAYNNIDFGKINYLDQIKIPAKSETTIKVDLTESNFDLLKKAPGILTSSLKGIKLIIDGFLNTQYGAIPFTKTTEII